MTNNIKKLTKTINRKNKAFDAMELRDQRVAIARDVIKALEEKKLVAQGGSYITIESPSVDGDYKVFNRNFPANNSMQETLKTIPQCTVCAKGAIFVCTVARRNQVKNGQVPDNNIKPWNGTAISHLLGGIFSPAQLRLIEVEFEGVDYESVAMRYTPSPLTIITPVMDLKRRFDDDEDRMICIMRNIIRNRGTFRPDKEIRKG